MLDGDVRMVEKFRLLLQPAGWSTGGAWRRRWASASSWSWKASSCTPTR